MTCEIAVFYVHIIFRFYLHREVN